MNLTDITTIPIPETKFGRKIHAWERAEIERTRADMTNPDKAVVREGVRYWRISDGTERVLPPFVYKDAYVECPPEQVRAYEAESAKSLAAYRKSMENHRYSDEEMFEMRAAFGPGTTVVNVLTGKRTKL